MRLWCRVASPPLASHRVLSAHPARRALRGRMKGFLRGRWRRGRGGGARGVATRAGCVSLLPFSPALCVYSLVFFLFSFLFFPLHIVLLRFNISSSLFFHFSPHTYSFSPPSSPSPPFSPFSSPSPSSSLPPPGAICVHRGRFPCTPGRRWPSGRGRATSRSPSYFTLARPAVPPPLGRGFVLAVGRGWRAAACGWKARIDGVLR